ncbi:MAG: hypothetical protein AAGJ46_06730 [Planctomycetota bacterium]
MTNQSTRFLLASMPLAALAAMPAAAPGQYYFDGYRGGYHASTAAEGYSRGVADVVRSQGAKNLMDSRAAINIEDARSKYLDNRVKAAETYWERRRIYKEARAEEQYAKSQQRQAQRSRVMLRQLAPQDLDPTTGSVAWPVLLKDAAFAKYRESLDGLFAKRAEYGELASADYLEAKTLIRDWRAAVTAAKSQYPEQAVRDALRFLLKLNRELDNNLG